MHFSCMHFSCKHFSRLHFGRYVVLGRFSYDIIHELFVTQADYFSNRPSTGMWLMQRLQKGKG